MTGFDHPQPPLNPEVQEEQTHQGVCGVGASPTCFLAGRWLGAPDTPTLINRLRERSPLLERLYGGPSRWFAPQIDFGGIGLG
jgi:hypothetical protein